MKAMSTDALREARASRRGWYWMQAALPLHHAETVEPFAGRRWSHARRGRGAGRRATWSGTQSLTIGVPGLALTPVLTAYSVKHLCDPSGQYGDRTSAPGL